MKSLAIKYRPQAFEDVCEQTSTITILKNQIETGTFKSSYLFVGSAGTGKTTCARLFANAINKQDVGSYMEIDAASNSSVEDVRELISQAQTQSITSEYKVIILDECHSFSSKAWQALLKLIEEPPAKTIFIFCTTEAHKVPNTILSRCQRFNFTRISYKGIVSRLSYILDCENATYQKSALEFIAKQADGGMRDAITMLDKCLSYTDNITLDNVIRAIGISDYDTMCDLTYSLLMKDKRSVVETIENMYRSGVDLKQFIKTYINFTLDITKFYITNDSFDFISIPKTYERWLKQITGDNDYLVSIYRILDMLLQIDSEIKYNPSPKYLIESKFILECVK